MPLVTHVIVAPLLLAISVIFLRIATTLTIVREPGALPLSVCLTPATEARNVADKAAIIASRRALITGLWLVQHRRNGGYRLARSR